MPLRGELAVANGGGGGAGKGHIRVVRSPPTRLQRARRVWRGLGRDGGGHEALKQPGRRQVASYKSGSCRAKPKGGQRRSLVHRQATHDFSGGATCRRAGGCGKAQSPPDSSNAASGLCFCGRGLGRDGGGHEASKQPGRRQVASYKSGSCRAKPKSGQRRSLAHRRATHDFSGLLPFGGQRCASCPPYGLDRCGSLSCESDDRTHSARPWRLRRWR